MFLVIGETFWAPVDQRDQLAPGRVDVLVPVKCIPRLCANSKIAKREQVYWSNFAVFSRYKSARKFHAQDLKARDFQVADRKISTLTLADTGYRTVPSTHVKYMAGTSLLCSTWLLKNESKQKISQVPDHLASDTC